MASQSLRPQTQKIQIIFHRDMCVGKNTAQAASVEFLRPAQKLCARQAVSLLAENSAGIFARDFHQASLPFSSGRTSFRASMATSSMESSGSKVVKFCIHMPGAVRNFVRALSVRPTQRLNS